MTSPLRDSDESLAGLSDELPLRAELFGAAQMEQHGTTLAGTHQLGEGKSRDLLLSRLADNEAVIIDTCNLLTETVSAKRQITPAAEWLLDNFYLIEDQIRTAKRHFPKTYSKQLPRLATGPSAGRPRVYDIALETISHGDGRVDPESLSRFVAAYQRVTPLQLGELWAIPIMLRLALIENLRRVAARVNASRIDRTLADSWADRMTDTAEKMPGDLILVVADMARSEPPLSGAFVSELTRRLQGQNPLLALPLTWVTQRLLDTGDTIENLVQADAQQQASNQVSVSNSIGSLRFLSAMDWREFVETMSLVEYTLLRDPTATYPAMDFSTRDQYRHVIEKMARAADTSEDHVAARAIEFAEQAASQHGAHHCTAHVGYYLIGSGVRVLEQAVGVRLSATKKMAHLLERRPLSMYLCAIALPMLVLTALIVLKAASSMPPLLVLLLTALFGLLSASQFGITLVNWIATLLATPHPLPRMNFSTGIPVEARTLVAIPTILHSLDEIDSLCEALEVRFLANRDAQLYFCLLTDFADAVEQTLDGDAELIAHASARITALNGKYAEKYAEKYTDDDAHLNAADSTGRFLLLHRPRRANAHERCWMGRERKRGKLADLNHLLRGRGGDAFSAIVGDVAPLLQVRFVITLDTDTQLPRDAARKFVATLAHPLNRAEYDEHRQCICTGYGILQPRVTTSLPGATASLYEKIFSGEPGIDPYTRTVSDVYQDLFGEGSFVGKGIYDVDAFELALDSKLPDNRILSHDLLEGCYARAGLISDTELHEAYPPRYQADVARRHRWIRGDWQLLPWLFSTVPCMQTSARSTSRQRNPLSPLSRWKLFDNLRRSLFSCALVALLLLGWIVLGTAWFWTGLAVLIVAAPAATALLTDLMRKPRELRVLQHLVEVRKGAALHGIHALLNLTFLPFEAFYSLDAIARTLWRVGVSRRRLLEWNPSSRAGLAANHSLPGSYRVMWFSPLLAALCAALLAADQPLALAGAAPLLLLWLLAPATAWWISRPQARREATVSEEQSLYLHALSRKTWRFFETFVGPEDNWLPPDNMQEKPVAVVAHRTSPTNIGLSLLANLAAYDFGYLPLRQLLERTGNTLRTMGGMERHQGHFYNWYDTQHLKPLLPMYVSTVDSGNLAAHLLTLRPGLVLLADAPILSPQVFRGIRDTLALLLAELPDPAATPLLKFRAQLLPACATPATSLRIAVALLSELSLDAENFRDTLGDSPENDLRWWARALARQCSDMHDEVLHVAPWANSPALHDTFLPPDLHAALEQISTPRQIVNNAEIWTAELHAFHASTALTAQQDVCQSLLDAIHRGARQAAVVLTELDRLALQAAEFAQMDFSFLHDDITHLLAIGYNVSERRRDISYYDLLASEARLTTFIAIAQGQLPQESWFALGRQLTIAGGEPILLSWSGSMFEYLMPLLVMPTFENTLLDQTCHAAIQRQIDYGAQRDVPWGISESGYYTFDAALNYQYRAFGVPGLGFKRGLGDDLVIAPYATMMALMVMPEAACTNLQRLTAAGFEGRYGMVEAIDYTSSRVPRGQSYAVIKSFMAHHQGMGFLSLAYLLLDQPMQRRFAADPLFQATMLLLHERIPKATAHYSNTSELADIRTSANEQLMPMRVFDQVDGKLPEIQLLSNGRYHVMISNAGGSYSRWRELAVTRWRADTTRDNWGSFCYVRDVDDGSFWSTALQPTLAKPQHQEVIFSEGRAEFRRTDNQIDMHTEIVVSPEDDIEMRRTKITNQSRVQRTLDITSYAEVVLAPHAADTAHPAFSNLFVQTELVEERGAILCTRRPRSLHEQMPWLLHQMVVHGTVVGAPSFETDRLKFIGRGMTPAAPQALTTTRDLSNSAGSVLDPVMAIRYRITLAPEESAIIDVVTGVTDQHDHALHLLEKYQDRYLADRVFELAWTHSQVVLRQLNASETDAQLYSRLASSVVYINPALRADAATLIKNRRGQSGLWSYAISGDLPIVLVQIKDQANIELVRQLVQAHAYWRLKGLAVDLVIWNEDHASYRQLLHEQIMGLIASGIDAQSIDRPGGIFVRLAEQIAIDDRILLQSVARVVLSDSRGTLAEQIVRRAQVDARIPALTPLRESTHEHARLSAHPQTMIEPERLLPNGVGGFSTDGREYLITTSGAQRTPAPWSNVLSNPHFGTVISESGQSYTWGENAHEFRLTPWHNDAVSDLSGEAFYIRDEDSGHFWSPMPLPCHSSGTTLTRHGFGYSVFEHLHDGIASELWIYVALDASIKYSVLKLHNRSGMPRRLSATGYVEWVLGDLRSKSEMHIITELDPLSGALFARNGYNTEFGERIAFFDVDSIKRSITCDRAEFIGRNGSLAKPAAMLRTRLSGKAGAGLDPCSAIQVPIDLLDGQRREIVFMLGVAGRRSADVSSLVQRYRGNEAAQRALDAVRKHWDHTLGAVQITTPDVAINVLTNGWLMYQTIACRLWARSGYYQSGGAFGFRDQLQDAMALIHTEPHLLREQLLRCAAHQFVEGDVQHWWHPPADRGVRTHCSDDYLWLPLATHRYVTSTGDRGVLNDSTHFIDGRPVNADEDSYYDLPQRANESANLYQHCVRAITRGLRFGEHGLPLIGSCDWNDGMDKVGEHGKGESVWLAFFLYDVLTKFIDIAQLMDDAPFAGRCLSEATTLRSNIERHGWDGDWYRRAYFDDGTPLGSASNSECQIDSISQSWAVLSGAGDATRIASAMRQVDQRLVRREHALIQLLDPPFSTSDLNPGYIRGYVPGVRENGGQYTHAAIWTAMAFAKLGDGVKAWELLGMINPINHARTAAEMAIYKVEPYVMAADVYAVSPHIGRGGWTWYTGSSGWMYRLIVESLLGITLDVDKLHLAPIMPAEWPSFEVRYRYRESSYLIKVTRSGAPGLVVDGVAITGTVVTMVDDGAQHRVEFGVGAAH